MAVGVCVCVCEKLDCSVAIEVKFGNLRLKIALVGNVSRLV